MSCKLTFEDGSEAYLTHYGIKGQKWGERNYQNADGTLTPEGIRRYRELNGRLTKDQQRVLRGTIAARNKTRRDNRNAAIAGGAASLAGAGLAAYGLKSGNEDVAKAGAGLAGGGLGWIAGTATGNALANKSNKKALKKVLVKSGKMTMSELDELMKLDEVSYQTAQSKRTAKQRKASDKAALKSSRASYTNAMGDAYDDNGYLKKKK